MIHVSFCPHSTATSPPPQTLGLRSSLELRLASHSALAIVFQLECVFSAPVGRETMVRSLNRVLNFNPPTRPGLSSAAGQCDLHTCSAPLQLKAGLHNNGFRKTHAHAARKRQRETLLSFLRPAFVLSPPGSHPWGIVQSISCQCLPEEITEGILAYKFRVNRQGWKRIEEWRRGQQI